MATLQNIWRGLLLPGSSHLSFCTLTISSNTPLIKHHNDAVTGWCSIAHPFEVKQGEVVKKEEVARKKHMAEQRTWENQKIQEILHLVAVELNEPVYA